MIASLPMYDLPEARGATDQFWAALADALGIDLPLARVGDHTIAWQRPDLIFSQTCGYPFTHAFAGKLTYVATPHYDADGCEGPDYCSILFAREAAPLERFRGKIAAYNNPDSMSGMLALKLVFAPLAQAGRFFENAVETGGHAASLAALQNGIADVAAVDCVTVALLRKHRPQALHGLMEVARSPKVPGLPYVTNSSAAPKLQAALAKVFADSSSETARAQLLLKGFSILPANAYDIILQRERGTDEIGGLKL